MVRLGQSDGGHCGGWMRDGKPYGGPVRGRDHEVL